MRAGGLEEQKGVRGECRERERYGARGEGGDGWDRKRER